MKREVFSYVFAVDASDVAVAVMIIYIGLKKNIFLTGGTTFKTLPSAEKVQQAREAYAFSCLKKQFHLSNRVCAGYSNGNLTER